MTRQVSCYLAAVSLKLCNECVVCSSRTLELVVLDYSSLGITGDEGTSVVVNGAAPHAFLKCI